MENHTIKTYLLFLACFLTTCDAQTDCAPSAMSRCTDPLKIVTDNKDLGFATSKDELIKMCPKLMDGLRCIDDFTLRCLDREHRAYFNTLYAGTTQVIVDLCQEGPYQTDYLRHAPCMRVVQAGYERCAADYQTRIKTLNARTQAAEDRSYYDDHLYEYEYLDEAEFAAEGREEGSDLDDLEPREIGSEDVEVKESSKKRKRRRRRRRGVEQYETEEESEENVKLLCCSFQKYLHCSESVVNTTCGYDTARFTKSFLDRMSGPLIQGHCQAYEYGTHGCVNNEQQHPWDEYNSYNAEQYSSSSIVSISTFIIVYSMSTFLLVR